MTYTVKVSNYEFACFVEEALKRMGIEPIGAGINLQSGIRDLEYAEFEVPAKFIPLPIEVNLPE